MTNALPSTSAAPATAAAVVEPIVALDVPSAGAARALVERLGDACRFYKVGSELFTAAGPDIVRWLRDRDADVFLDLKFHDIPNTVAGAVRSAAALGVRLLTVHAVGGRAMLEAAAAAARAQAGDACGVLAVTVLTSHDAASLGSAWGRDRVRVDDEVVRLAGDAAASGVHGVVCSGHEAALVLERHANSLALLVPGVRLPGDATHDQARVVTPVEAARAGARYLVLGRTVTAAADPVVAMRAVRASLA